jgi:hypothetical protein
VDVARQLALEAVEVLDVLVGDDDDAAWLFTHQRPLTQAVVLASRWTTSAWPDHGSFSSPRTIAQNGQS